MSIAKRLQNDICCIILIYKCWSNDACCQSYTGRIRSLEGAAALPAQQLIFF